jgi:hypothetical protein
VDNWTPERERIFVELHAAGLSYGLIAHELDKRTGFKVTSSAVNSKRCRMKLPTRKPPTPGAGRKADKLRTPIGPVDSLNVTLADLCIGQCRYVTSDEPLFCGHPTDGGVHCGWHRTFSHVPVELRIRQKQERNDDQGRPGLPAQG